MADNRMTAERIAEIKARCAAASTAPWAVDGKGRTVCRPSGCSWGGYHPVAEVDWIFRSLGGNLREEEQRADADFIAHSRTDLPDAILRIEHLEAALRAVMERKGPYSQNPLKHAENTILSMADIARRGLEGEELE